MKILIVKTSSMGDVIHMLPAVTDIATSIPNVEIDWCVEQAFAEIPSWHPAVRRVIPVAIRQWRKHWLRSVRHGAIKQFYQQLTATQYDVIIDAQSLVKSALIARCAKGTRHGLDKGSAREPLASVFYQHKYVVAKQQHAITRIRELCSKVLRYELPTREVDYGITARNHSIKPSPYCVLIHGTSREDKLWDVAHWVSVARLMRQQGIEVLLPWGSATEQQRAQAIVEQAGCGQVLAKMNLTQLKDTLAQAHSVIAVDTGLGHLSVALGKSTVSLYASTDPVRIGTLGKGQRHCQMQDVSPNDVVRLLLREQPVSLHVSKSAG